MRTTHVRPPLSAIDPKWRIGIVYSSFYKEEIDGMTQGAITFLVQQGIPKENISLHEAAGSFEVPLIGEALASAGKVDALIGLGVIVEGETGHAELLAEETARGMMDVQLTHGLPFAFEILHVDTLAQAQARSTGKDNKGIEAAYAVLHSLLQLKRIRDEKN